MTFLLILFGVIIVLELACLVGLFFALQWVDMQRAYVDGAREVLPLVRTTLLGQLRHTELTVKQVISVLGLVERFIPGWIKIAYNTLRWVGKIKI